MTEGRPERRTSVAEATRSLLGTGVLLGVGIAGSLDEIVFHQILQWHNFYVHTSLQGRILSDGLFHAFSAALLVWAAIRLWRDRALLAAAGRSAALVAGVLLGAGGFNLYDGIVDHKLLHLHEVREGVPNVLPYDLAFDGLAVAVLLAGYLVWQSVERERTARGLDGGQSGDAADDGREDRAA